MVFYPVADFLKGGVGFVHMFNQSPVRTEGKYEVFAFDGPFLV